MNPYRHHTPTLYAEVIQSGGPRAWILSAATGFLAALAMVGAPFVCGCTKTEAKTAVDVAVSFEQMACVIAQAELGANEPEAIAALCSIPTSAIISLTSVLMAQQKGHAMAMAAKKGSK